MSNKYGEFPPHIFDILKDFGLFNIWQLGREFIPLFRQIINTTNNI